MTRYSLAITLCLTMFGLPLRADAPGVVAAKASRAGMGWRFDVTLKHPDTGWDHYADAWEVVDATSTRLAIRRLAHPHVAEQPFTRSLSGVMLPDGMTRVYIRAKCSQGHVSKTLFPVDLGN